MKKGTSHADWAISMGLFLVAIMVLLMFLRPGFQAEHKEDVLSWIIEEGVKNNVTLNVEKIPVYIEIIDPIVYPSGTYVMDFNIEHFPINDLNKYFIMLDSKNQRINNFLISNSGAGTKNIKARVFLDANDLNLFYIVYTPGIDQTSTDPGAQTLAESAVEITIGPIARNNGIYNLWVEDLSKLCSTETGYTGIKADWKYPPNKEFEIYIDGKKICNMAEPSTRDDVFVRSWKGIKVDNNGLDYGTIDFSVRTW
ncbi:MAG: hypothetical protein PHT54_01220 [Candidatus Nanoarchaeia archaeon]|nr:hypothetical protein [Candidatus Nanoarchaeia archaeon]